MRKHIIIVLGSLLLLLSGCGASRISFDVVAPAVQTVPAEIKTVSIINRTLPSNSDANMLEGLLTGEGLRQDTLTSTFVLRGLDESLRASGRFNAILSSEKMTGSGIGTLLPDAISWKEVETICEKYGSDALIALESYDSDFIITGASGGNRLLDIHASGLITVNCGFRLYYPADRRIIDEFMFKHQMEWGGGGLAVIAAADALINKKKFIEKASLEAGHMYGNRLTPDWVYVSRDYFKKGGGDYNLAEGARMMQLNDWDKAIAALERAMESDKRKVRGRAAHNLAVIYEILGDLYKAKEWTTVAWGRYKEKKSRDYGYILTRRIQEMELLDYQMDR